MIGTISCCWNLQVAQICITCCSSSSVRWKMLQTLFVLFAAFEMLFEPVEGCDQNISNENLTQRMALRFRKHCLQISHLFRKRDVSIQCVLTTGRELTRNQLSSLDDGTCAKVWMDCPIKRSRSGWMVLYTTKIQHFLKEWSWDDECPSNHFFTLAICSSDFPLSSRYRSTRPKMISFFSAGRLKGRHQDDFSAAIQRCSNLVRQRSSAVAFSIGIDRDLDWVYWSMLDEDHSMRKACWCSYLFELYSSAPLTLKSTGCHIKMNTFKRNLNRIVRLQYRTGLGSTLL